MSSQRCPTPTSLLSQTPAVHATAIADNNAYDIEDASLHTSADQEKEKDEAARGSLYTWDGPSDPEHPTNWPLWKKLITTVMLAATTFTISLNSAMFAPATEQVVQELGVGREVATLGTSLYLLVRGLGDSVESLHRNRAL